MKLLYLILCSLIITSCSTKESFQSKTLNCSFSIDNLDFEDYSNEIYSIKLPLNLDTLIKRGKGFELSIPVDSTFEGVAPSIYLSVKKDTNSILNIFTNQVNVLEKSETMSVIEKGETLINKIQFNWLLVETNQNYKKTPLRGIIFHTKKGENAFRFSILEIAEENSICQYLPSLFTLHIK